MSKNSLFRDEENEKVIRNPHIDPDHHQKLIISRGSPLDHVTPWPGHPLTMPDKFGQRPFVRSSVVLFTDWRRL